MAVTKEQQKKANSLCFVRRKKRKNHDEEERQRLIDEWLETHEITRTPAGWSHYGWQS